MSTIVTEAKAVERSIELDMPAILTAETLSDLVNIQGEDLCVKQIKAQLTIAFRSKIRGLLSSKTEDDFTNSDEEIAEMDFSDWKPEARVRKSAEEKAMDILGSLPPEVRAAVLENYQG
jgi:hypothetical protein